jgi:SAM-dependent methyltransferase
MRLTTAHHSVHVGGEDVTDCRACCPICGDDGIRKQIVPLQHDPDIGMLVCRHCRGTSASHMPTDRFLERYYTSYHDGRSARVTFFDTERFATHVVAALPNAWKSSALRILDFGGGDGTLAVAIAERLLAARATAVDITVVDWNEPVVVPDARMRIDAVRTIEECAGQYDLVIASAVLEHVPDLRMLLPKLISRMRFGGLLYARTPYAIPLRKLLPFVDVGYPAHVHDLGRDFWETLPGRFPALRVVISRPSLVASPWRRDPLRALAAHVMKFPSRIMHKWPFVGGWEVVLESVA